MATCYKCGEEIEFIYNGFSAIPIHPSGSCMGRAGGYGAGAGSTFRLTASGNCFEFPFVTYPSYVNPNARCPVCGEDVYFYQSPYGGKVFFDELGPPWPKHPCTDDSDFKNRFSSVEGRSRISFSKNILSETRRMATKIIPWVDSGWMPFVVTKIVSRPVGIEAEGKLFVTSESEPIMFRIVQSSPEARFYRIQGKLRIGSDLVQNASRIVSVLNECPVLLRKEPDMRQLMLNSFIMTRDEEIEGVELLVSGVEISS